MDELETDEDGQTFAFESESAWDVYFFRGIVLPREFKFLKAGLGQVYSNSILKYDLFLPFENKLHSDDNCVTVEHLPCFLRKKDKKI